MFLFLRSSNEFVAAIKSHGRKMCFDDASSGASSNHVCFQFPELVNSHDSSNLKAVQPTDNTTLLLKSHVLRPHPLDRSQLLFDLQRLIGTRHRC